MELGVGLAIFLVLATLVFLSFYCITKYRHNKLKNNLNSGINDSLRSCQDFNDQEEYDQYLELEKNKKGNMNEPYQLQQYNTIKPLQEDTFRSHSWAHIINNPLIPLKQEKILAKSSLRTLAINPLTSTKVAGNTLHAQQQPTQLHDYISRLVGYETGKITIVQIYLKSIKKDQSGRIVQFKKIRKNEFRLQEEGQGQFNNSLQAFSLEQYHYGGFKFVSRIQVNNMISNQQYQLKNFKVSQFKEWIELSEFKEISQKLLR